MVGWVAKLAGVAVTFRDRMFAKKLVAFVAGTSTASPEKIAAFVDSLHEAKHRERAGETLLLLIDRHERIEKSDILGRLLAARIEGHFDGERFLAVAAALDRCSIGELLVVKRAVEIGVVQGSQEAIWEIARTGLVTVDLTGAPVGGGVRVKGELSQLGKEIVEFGLAGLRDDDAAGFP